jgi:LysM repeat protein
LYIDTNTTNVTNITSLNGTRTSTNSTSISARARALAPRTTCSTITVASGDGCASLAQKCGITGAQFTQYNPASNECSTLQPGEHVCCSAGTLPNFAPSPQCATYTIQPNDDCSSIAATWSITVAEINSYNTDTWGWSGCTLIYADASYVSVRATRQCRQLSRMQSVGHRSLAQQPLQLARICPSSTPALLMRAAISGAR